MAPLKTFIGAACMLAALATAPLAHAKDNIDAYQKLILGRHYKQAVALLTKSARTGNPLSQYRLAVMLRSGLGTKRDDAKARDWLRKAEAGGNAEAGKLLKSLASIVTTDAIPVPDATSLRNPRIASLAKLKPLPSAKQDWLIVSAARPF
jgi:TPR repeat protein